MIESNRRKRHVLRQRKRDNKFHPVIFRRLTGWDLYMIEKYANGFR